MTLTFLLFLFFIFFTILPNYVYSYCIYNKMTDPNALLYVEQLDGQGPGGRSPYVLLYIIFFIPTPILKKNYNVWNNTYKCSRYCRSRHFRHNIPANGSECCAWDNIHCNNANNDINSPLAFLVNSSLYYYIIISLIFFLFFSVHLLRILG